jgi:hypothetical protein
MTEIFTAAEIEVLSAEIDRQLPELRQSGNATYKSGDELEPGGTLSKQQESIESLTQMGWLMLAMNPVIDRSGIS